LTLRGARSAQLETERASLEAEIRRLIAAIAAGGDLGPLVEFYKANEFEETGRGVARLMSWRSMPCVFMRKLLTGS